MFDAEGFVADLRAALSESAPQLAVREIVLRAMRRPLDELTRAFSPPPPPSWGRCTDRPS